MLIVVDTLLFLQEGVWNTSETNKTTKMSTSNQPYRIKEELPGWFVQGKQSTQTVVDVDNLLMEINWLYLRGNYADCFHACRRLLELEHTAPKEVVPTNPQLKQCNDTLERLKKHGFTLSTSSK